MRKIAGAVIQDSTFEGEKVDVVTKNHNIDDLIGEKKWWNGRMTE